MLYESEALTTIRRLEAFQIWVWGRMEKVSWTEHKANEEVLRKLEEERSLADNIKESQRNWIGHNTDRGFHTENYHGGKIGGRKKKVKPRRQLLCWMMVDGQ